MCFTFIELLAEQICTLNLNGSRVMKPHLLLTIFLFDISSAHVPHVKIHYIFQGISYLHLILLTMVGQLIFCS